MLRCTYIACLVSFFVASSRLSWFSGLGAYLLHNTATVTTECGSLILFLWTDSDYIWHGIPHNHSKTAAYLVFTLRWVMAVKDKTPSLLCTFRRWDCSDGTLVYHAKGCYTRVPCPLKDLLIEWLTKYWLSPSSRVLLKEAKRFSASQETSTFYGTRRFITAFTRVRHLSLFWATPILSMAPSHFL